MFNIKIKKNYETLSQSLALKLGLSIPLLSYFLFPSPASLLVYNGNSSNALF